jgi:hypothetical protein
MAQMGRPCLSSQHNEELWARWKAGQSVCRLYLRRR